jgi:hypothetical protein
MGEKLNSLSHGQAQIRQVVDNRTLLQNQAHQAVAMGQQDSIAQPYQLSYAKGFMSVSLSMTPFSQKAVAPG